MNKKLLLIIILFIIGKPIFLAQDINLYKQFNGRYDFKFFGNTLNKVENGLGTRCEINTSSSDMISMGTSDTIIGAYLYWAGSGIGVFNVKLNNQPIIAEREFNTTQVINGVNRIFFSAFTDITTFVKNTGNGLYTLSELDLTNIISPLYCQNGTNFAGWAIIIVYENSNLPLNQLNIYDGLQHVPEEINITLSSLNVIDNYDAKIGFLAWEGDRGIDKNESLRINGNLISNPPLNPATNAFNGTNSSTGSTSLYNMDLDIYSITNNINIGDSQATIQLTSSQDFVMINAIVTKLNSQLPDATITVNNIIQNCNSLNYTLNYTVRNFNSTNFLPAGTYTTFYINNEAIATAQTHEDIPIGESRNYQINFTLDEDIVGDFELKLKVDNNRGVANVTEIVENNNEYLKILNQWNYPEFKELDDLNQCVEGENSATYDFSTYEQSVKVNLTDNAKFFETLEDATNYTNPILNLSNYTTHSFPKTIYVRVFNSHCFKTTSFQLVKEPCYPVFYNHFTPNGDNTNDNFYVQNLRDFPNFKLSIYNRWGTLIWVGDINTPDWDGKSNQGAVLSSRELPVGTYYYVAELNYPKYPDAITGWIFLNR